MKNIIKGTEPNLLAQYRVSKPDSIWNEFKGGRSRRQQLNSALLRDQGGLCAYCEMDLKEADEDGNADFRVEHFHPKSDNTSIRNWNLDWQNLLGCCHGGSQRSVVDSVRRFTSPDHSCDVPKKDQNLDDIILNPLDLPPFPVLFTCERATGKLFVQMDNCKISGISAELAQQTIDKLRLDAPRLNRFRTILLNDLNLQLQKMVLAGQSVGQARARLARGILAKNMQNNWPAFFTSIRSYLGSEAEKHLQETGYKG